MLWKIFCRWEDDYAPNCFAGSYIALGWGGRIRDPERHWTLGEIERALIQDHPKHFGPEAPPTRLPGVAGMVFRFLHEVRRGDLVILPDGINDVYYVGIVESDAYSESEERANTQCPFRLRRRVRWYAEPLSHDQARAIWGSRQFGGVQTLSSVRTGEDALREFMRFQTTRARATKASRNHIATREPERFLVGP